MPETREGVVLAGGGSGGHIFPALAIAERLIEVDPDVQAIFVCSEREIDRRILQGAGVDFRPVPARPWSTRPGPLASFGRGWVRSRRRLAGLLRDEGVREVVALGGFVAAPAVSAAASLGIPATLLNLDAQPGRANLWLARRCSRVLSAVPTPSMPAFAREITGMPIRRQALRQDDPETCRRRLGLDPHRPTLLIVGGSQGAETINRLLEAVAADPPRELAGWQVCHLCGEGTADPALRVAYAAAGIPAVVMPFLDRMDWAWGAADLALSRAGASSVAEAGLNAVPTVFLPYPFHRDRHQHLNAEPLAAAGAAVIHEDLIDPDRNRAGLIPVLRDLLRNAGRRAEMREAALRGAVPDAALRIARLLAQSSPRAANIGPQARRGAFTMPH